MSRYDHTMVYAKSLEALKEKVKEKELEGWKPKPIDVNGREAVVPVSDGMGNVYQKMWRVK